MTTKTKTPTKKTTKTKAPPKGRPPAIADDKAIEIATRILVKTERQPSEAAARAYLVACGAKRFLALHRYSESD